MAALDAQPFRWHDPEVDDDNFRLRGHGLTFLVVIIFSIALLFVLLCLYLWWACRCPSADGPGPPSASCLVPSGLDADVINSVPVVRVHFRQSRDEEAGQCSICLGVPGEGDKMKELPGCSHTYHPECIDEWLRTRSSCPLCRAPLGRFKEGSADAA